MNNIINDWYIYMAILALVVVAIWLVYRFFSLPTEKQLAKVKEWLIFAIIEAEKALQSGTGKLKLRSVYNTFLSIPSFNWIARIISFEQFSDMVDEALETVKMMLCNNATLAEYVYGENAKEETSKMREQLCEQTKKESN